MSADSVERETFEKWVAKELGSEMLRKVRDNGYIHSGAIKFLFEYFFANVYSAKYARLVKLNLDRDFNDASKQDEDEELTALKIRNIELKKRLEEQRQRCYHEEAEIATLANSHGNMQRVTLSRLRQEMCQKHMNRVVQDVYLQNAKAMTSQIEQATAKFARISHNIHMNESAIKRDQYDTSMLAFQNFGRRDGGDIKLNHLAIKECFEIFDVKINDYLMGVDNIDNNDQLRNEVQVFMYQNDMNIDAAFEATLLNRPNAPTVTDAMNAFNYDIIQRSAEMFKRKTTSNQCQSKMNELTAKLKEYIMNKYSSQADARMYATHLRTYLKFKNLEINERELKRFTELFEAERKMLSNTVSVIGRKLEMIKELAESAYVKHVKNERTLTANEDFLANQLREPMLAWKSAAESLFEHVRAFSRFHFGINDSVLLKNLEQFSTRFVIDSAHLLDKHEGLFSSEVRQMLSELCAYREAKAKFTLLGKLEQVYAQTGREVEWLAHSHITRAAFVNSEETVKDLHVSLQQAIEVDTNNMNKYKNLIEDLLAKIKEAEDNLEEVNLQENLVRIYRTQPGAYECPLNTTVNGHSLIYYVKLVDEALAEFNRKKSRQNI